MVATQYKVSYFRGSGIVLDPVNGEKEDSVDYIIPKFNGVSSSSIEAEINKQKTGVFGTIKFRKSTKLDSYDGLMLDNWKWIEGPFDPPKKENE